LRLGNFNNEDFRKDELENGLRCESQNLSIQTVSSVMVTSS
jgi:hypothetical protein